MRAGQGARDTFKTSGITDSSFGSTNEPTEEMKGAMTTGECKQQERWLESVSRDTDMSDYFLYKYVTLLREVKPDEYLKMIGRY